MTGSVLRLSFVSPELGECSVTFDKPVVRFGRDPDADVCLMGVGGRGVAFHHGAFIREVEGYTLVEREPSHALFVSGERIRRLVLQGGERIHLGSPEGPEIRVVQVGLPRVAAPPGEEESTDLVDPAELQKLQTAKASPLQLPHSVPSPSPTRRALPTISTRELAPQAAQSQERPAGAPGQQRVFTTGTLKTFVRRLIKPHAEVQQALFRARKELAVARSAGRDGHTMVVLARALMGMRHSAEARSRRWKRSLWAVLLGSLALVMSLSTVIWLQQQSIVRMVGQKAALDAQIQAVFNQMASETDEQQLEVLETRLEALMGSAAEKLVQVRRANVQKAQELATPPDELEVEIRKILHSFNADTYAIPPIFKEALRKQVDDLSGSPALGNAYARKLRYWSEIQGALQRKQLPEELGYIAFAESRFDPLVVNSRSKASGMWQMMEEAARRCGLSVRPGQDERLDPARSSDGAACYLSKLLAEYGEESFMLVLASYNRGENGVRRALHKLAREPGGYRKRDFWHLYRLKLLPEETRDYVPKVLAAAIVLGNPERYGLHAEP